MNVLVDTSVWSLALRRVPRDLNSAETAIVNELVELINEGRAKNHWAGPSRAAVGNQELSQSTKLREVLRSFTDESVGTADYEAAAAAGNQCRQKGLGVSVVDLLICAVAQSRGWAIFTTDPDFDRYRRVLS